MLLLLFGALLARLATLAAIAVASRLHAFCLLQWGVNAFPYLMRLVPCAQFALADTIVASSKTCLSFVLAISETPASELSPDEKAARSEQKAESEAKWSRLAVDIGKRCKGIVWHAKGDYFATWSNTDGERSRLNHCSSLKLVVMCRT